MILKPIWLNWHSTKIKMAKGLKAYSHGTIATAIYFSQLMGCMRFSVLSQSQDVNTHIESYTTNLLG